MASKKKDPTFEEGMERLRALVSALEGGKLPLKETLAAYEEGKALLKALDSQLSEGERRIHEMEVDGSVNDITGEVAEAKEGTNV